MGKTVHVIAAPEKKGRRGLSLDPESEKIAKELALKYHGENVSRLVRHLLRVAWENPEIAKAA